MYWGWGLLLDNCRYDITETSSKGSNRNATIVACRNKGFIDLNMKAITIDIIALKETFSITYPE